MLSRRILFLFFLWLVHDSNCFSQQHVAYSSLKSSWRLAYDPFHRDKNVYGNYILEELAKHLLKVPSRVILKVGFENGISLSKADSVKYYATIRADRFSVSGDLTYRSFPMAGETMPSGFSCMLKISSRLDTSDFSVLSFGGELPSDGRPLVFRTPPIVFDTAFDTLICGDFSFHWRETDWNRFYKRKALIDDYYASASILDSLLQEVKGWNMLDPAAIPVNYIRLAELVRVLETIRSRDFAQRLTHGGMDSMGLEEKQLALFRISRSSLYNLKETLEKQGAIRGYASMDTLSNYFVGRLMRFIVLSSIVENINGEIYADYLNSVWEVRVSDNDTLFMMEVLSRLFPDTRSDSLLILASESLMKAYRSRAELLVNGRQYAEALMLMDNARKMASVNPYLKNRNGWAQMMSKAATGVYNSYAGIASTSLEGGNVTMAMEYLSKAELYRQKYPSSVVSDSLYRKVYREIFIGQLDRCNSILGAGEFERALDCFSFCENEFKGKMLEILLPEIEEKKEISRAGILNLLIKRCEHDLEAGSPDSALKLYDQAGRLIASMTNKAAARARLDSLAGPVETYRVGRIRNLAAAYFRQRQFPRAIMQFEEAKRICATWSIPSDAMADSLYMQSYKQWLLDRIALSHRLIWSGMADSAASFITAAEKTAENKGLSGDKDIQKAVDNYRQQISRYGCSLMEDSLNIYNIRAGRCFAMRNYNRGAMILEQAIRQTASLKNCNFELTPLYDSLKKYSEVVNYQRILEEANNCMVTGDYPRGLQLLEGNERTYISKRIDRFGVPATSVYDYVSGKANPFITIKALEYYEPGDPAEGLRYLSLLRVQGAPQASMDECQVKLGRSMAARDRLLFADADPAAIVLRYTASASWMNRFVESYVREWKR